MKKPFLVLLNIFVLHGVAEAADKIRIAVGVGNSSVLWPLAQKKGFLKDEGIDAEVIQMLGNLPVAALTNGGLDYNTTLNPVVRGAIQGLAVRVVACFDKGNQWVLVGRSNLKSVIDLKGKTVAVSNPGTGSDVAGRRIVKHFGLEPDKDVKFTAGGPDEGRLIRLQQGLIDATTGQFKLIWTGAGRTGKPPRPPTSFCPKQINEDGGLPEQGFRLLIEEIRESVKLSLDVSFNEVSDLSILREAQLELGIKGN